MRIPYTEVEIKNPFSRFSLKLNFIIFIAAQLVFLIVFLFMDGFN